MTDLARIEQKIDRLLALIESREHQTIQREEEAEYIASLQGLPWQEAVARNRARNKRMEAIK